MFVFVLLFNTHSKDEGIYSFKTGTRNTILMFESGVGANYYASMLVASGFPQSTVELFHMEDIYNFCKNSGYDHKFIPAQTVVIPPSRHSGSSQRYANASAMPQVVKASSIISDSSQRERYLATLGETYSLYKKNIADIQLEKARRGFSVELNRQLEYYTEELQKVEKEIQNWLSIQPEISQRTQHKLHAPRLETAIQNSLSARPNIESTAQARLNKNPYIGRENNPRNPYID